MKLTTHQYNFWVYCLIKQGHLIRNILVNSLMLKGLIWLHPAPLSNQATNSTDQSLSWEASSHSTSYKIPCLLWNPKIHYHDYKSPPLVPVKSHRYSVHTFPCYFPKIHSSRILPSTPWSSTWCLPLKVFSPSLYAFLVSPMHMICTAHIILLYLITRTSYTINISLPNSTLIICFKLTSPTTDFSLPFTAYIT
jgi:hypothetical protein